MCYLDCWSVLMEMLVWRDRLELTRRQVASWSSHGVERKGTDFLVGPSTKVVSGLEDLHSYVEFDRTVTGPSFNL